MGFLQLLPIQNHLINSFITRASLLSIHKLYCQREIESAEELNKTDNNVKEETALKGNAQKTTVARGLRISIIISCPLMTSLFSRYDGFGIISSNDDNLTHQMQITLCKGTTKDKATLKI